MNEMNYFVDVTKKVQLINDFILSDMVCDVTSSSEDLTNFSHHLLATKNWFSRISWANKKCYLIALLEDVRSAWTLSLLLKSLWNCRLKDSILSISERSVWSSYDLVPMDHNRTALPITTLAQVMKNDRGWFLSLSPEPQAMVLSELLTIAGGPVMWSVLSRAQILYDRYRRQQLQNLQESIVVNDNPTEKTTIGSPEKVKKDTPGRKGSGSPDISGKQAPQPGQAQKELEANLAAWNATIKSMKDSLKLEEVEITFNDGTKRKIWKVNRPKPEAVETVDFLQLLPSSIGKKILSYLPRAQLGDYAKINRYWSFLVDEFRAELTARQKIDMDLDKLKDIMLRHDTSLEVVEQSDFPRAAPPSSLGNASGRVSLRAKAAIPSMRASEKSGGAYSLRHFLSGKLKKQTTLVQTPIRNMAELTGRLERRGAADENLWKWCENVLKNVKSKKEGTTEKTQESVMSFENEHIFPCPMMRERLEVPLVPPLHKDPAITPPIKPRKNIYEATIMQSPKEHGVRKYSLWMRNFSSLYPVFKIASHQYPF